MVDLKAIAEADLATTLEGDGQAITVTDPEGNTAVLQGRTDDIAQLIDPETGNAVSGRLASVTLRISAIKASSLVGLPVDIADESKKPWIIELTDVNGVAYVFKVEQSNPDQGLGLITCLLETYKK